MKKFVCWLYSVPWWLRFIIGDLIFFLFWLLFSKYYWDFANLSFYFHVGSASFGVLLGFLIYYFCDSLSSCFMRIFKSRKAAPIDPEA